MSEPLDDWDPTKPSAGEPMWKFWLLISPLLVVLVVAVIGAVQALAVQL